MLWLFLDKVEKLLFIYYFFPDTVGYKFDPIPLKFYCIQLKDLHKLFLVGVRTFLSFTKVHIKILMFDSTIW